MRESPKSAVAKTQRSPKWMREICGTHTYCGAAEEKSLANRKLPKK